MNLHYRTRQYLSHQPHSIRQPLFRYIRSNKYAISSTAEMLGREVGCSFEPFPDGLPMCEFKASGKVGRKGLSVPKLAFASTAYAGSMVYMIPHTTSS